MSIIALFNFAKKYFDSRRTNHIFRKLDEHHLRDIGFYRDNGTIRPLKRDQNTIQDNQFKPQIPPKHKPRDG